jgi:CRISPR/Cas system-associated protein endoribonuclease Cas2
MADFCKLCSSLKIGTKCTNARCILYSKNTKMATMMQVDQINAMLERLKQTPNDYDINFKTLTYKQAGMMKTLLASRINNSVEEYEELFYEEEIL